MAAGQLWAGVDVGKEHHWVCVVDDTGVVVLSRKLVNDEQPIRDLVAEIDQLADEVSWTVDLTTVYAALLLTVFFTRPASRLPACADGGPARTTSGCARAAHKGWPDCNGCT